jgi:hypothetical protein
LASLAGFPAALRSPAYAQVCSSGAPNVTPLLRVRVRPQTLLNWSANGCVYAMPILLALGLLLSVYAVGLCWRKGVAPGSR